MFTTTIRKPPSCLRIRSFARRPRRQRLAKAIVEPRREGTASPTRVGHRPTLAKDTSMRIHQAVVSHHIARRVVASARRTRRHQEPTGTVYGRRFRNRKATSSRASASPSASDGPPPPAPPRGFMEFAKFLRAVPDRFPLLERDFTIQAARHPNLAAAYPTLDALVRDLRPSKKGGLPDRTTLIASIVKAHQASPHPVWSTVLLRVFSPILWKVRVRLMGGDEDTRDEILLEETQHALLTMRTTDPARISMYFRQRLRRRVFRALAEVTRWENVGFGSDPEDVAHPATVHPPRLLGHWLRAASPEQRELVATFVDDGGLHPLVRRMAKTPEEHAVVHSRLRKRRQRVVDSLREELGDASTRAKNFSEH